MNKKKILIFKNDRGGDLFTSLNLISNLIKNNNVKIYLSELNIGFSFFFLNIQLVKIKFNLSFINKINIIYDLFKNNYEEIYILTPKNFYFFLPFFFRKTKFFAIVYNSQNKLRPINFLRNYLYKYKIVYRNKINKKSYRELQIDLLGENISYDDTYKNLNIPTITTDKLNLLPNNFILFQFKYIFFERLGWGNDEIVKILNSLLDKYECVLFFSDIEDNKFTKKYTTFFQNEFSYIDLNKKIKNTINDKKIIYLKKLGALDLFHIIKLSKKNLGPHGIISHISFFHDVSCHNLYNFKIKNINDYKHEKISFSEWCKNMGSSFSFLNSDINKAVRKIMRNV